MGKPDHLDRLLTGLPSPEPQGDLPGRVKHFVRVRRRRRSLVRIGASLALAGCGIWLCTPAAATLPVSTNFSGSAIHVLGDWLQAGLAGLEGSLNYLWSSLTGAQNNLTAFIGPGAWIGLTALALSVLIALGQLVPQQPGTERKGKEA
ncbi:MAG TPA: hypothetical protein VMC09_10760 [Anaerolineales bacterium]|nr:hypothetical protein [Anaerolineales bacterium]